MQRWVFSTALSATLEAMGITITGEVRRMPRLACVVTFNHLDALVPGINRRGETLPLCPLLPHQEARRRGYGKPFAS